MSDFLIRSLIIGGGATLVLDLWSLFLSRTAGIPMTNWAMPGRWVMHLPRGTFMHESIAKAEPVNNELAIGWVFHYFCGVFFAGVMLLLWPAWAKNPTFWPPMIVGWATILCGWLILAPGVGAGWAHAKRPDANRARLLNIVGHTIFGLAMWIIGIAISRM